MIKLKAISIFCIAVFFLACFVSSASAGVEPSPFKSDANKLEAVINNFESMEKRLNDALGMPLDDIMPGTANKLGAMNNELVVIELRIDRMHGIRRVDSGEIQGEYIGAHEAGHSFLSFVDEYVEGGFEDMNIVHELREMYLSTTSILTLLESYIRPDRG